MQLRICQKDVPHWIELHALETRRLEHFIIIEPTNDREKSNKQTKKKLIH